MTRGYPRAVHVPFPSLSLLTRAGAARLPHSPAPVLGPAPAPQAPPVLGQIPPAFSRASDPPLPSSPRRIHMPLSEGILPVTF